MEKRQFPTKRTLLSATVFFNNGQFSLPCTIRDVSVSGMRLNVSDAIVLPDRFVVRIPSQDITHSVCLKWRRAGDAGLALAGQQVEIAWNRAPRASSDHISALEAEILRLNHLVASISKERDDLRRLLKQAATHPASDGVAGAASIRNYAASDGTAAQNYDVYDDINHEWTTSTGAVCPMAAKGSSKF